MPKPSSSPAPPPPPSSSSSSSHSNPIPRSFTAPKARILSGLSTPADSYTDKSPKGSVDTAIVDLINEINGYAGFVTTSSCAGRVSVFVEGEGKERDRDGEGEGDEDEEEGLVEEQGQGRGEEKTQEERNRSAMKKRREMDGTRGVVGGKGGGRWQFVSHERVALEEAQQEDGTVGQLRDPASEGNEVNQVGEALPITKPTMSFTQLFHLSPIPAADSTPSTKSTSSSSTTGLKPPHRLVRLAFEPFILHVQCASLSHARPLLAAALSAGFRESGVQSLRNLEHPDSCPMVAVRSAGLALESVVGVVKVPRLKNGERGANGILGEVAAPQDEVYEAVVGEEYLELLVGVANARFGENERRRERFRLALRQMMGKRVERLVENGGEGGGGGGGGAGRVSNEGEQELSKTWEDKETRRARKREEGLRLRNSTKKSHGSEEVWDTSGTFAQE